MTGDRCRPKTAAAVLLVAGIAAAVSYMHVASPELRHRQSPLAVRLLPLSIDGLAAAASLVVLRAARPGVPARWLASRTGVRPASVSLVVAAETAIMVTRRWSSPGHDRPAGKTAASGGHRPRGDGRGRKYTRARATSETSPAQENGGSVDQHGGRPQSKIPGRAGSVPRIPPDCRSRTAGIRRAPYPRSSRTTSARLELTNLHRLHAATGSQSSGSYRRYTGDLRSQAFGPYNG